MCNFLIIQLFAYSAVQVARSVKGMFVLELANHAVHWLPENAKTFRSRKIGVEVTQVIRVVPRNTLVV